MRARVALLAAVLLLVPTGSADVFPVDMASGAFLVANEMVDQGGLLKGASFLTGGTYAVGTGLIGTPAAWANETVTNSFGMVGTGFGLISNGGADWADDPNTIGSTSGSIGNPYRNAYDATVIAMTIDVPQGDTCLVVSFQFLTEEFPEYMNQAYNDGFIAELDNHTWTTAGASISAPDNFARDPNGNLISVNSPIGFSTANAAGSTYDGASPRMTAKTATTPGEHILYLSVFDAGDWDYDSTIFIDNIHTKPGDGSTECPYPPNPEPPVCQGEGINGSCDPPPPNPVLEPPPKGKGYIHRFWPPQPFDVPLLTSVSGEKSRTDVMLDSETGAGDSDGDGVLDNVDTCLGMDGDGLDQDGDGLGALCDNDADGDGLINRMDACPDDPDPECGLEQVGKEASGGRDAASGRFGQAEATGPGAGSVQVEGAESTTSAMPVPVLLGVALAVVLLLLVSARRRD